LLNSQLLKSFSVTCTINVGGALVQIQPCGEKKEATCKFPLIDLELQKWTTRGKGKASLND
jgi:hypothetical protein